MKTISTSFFSILIFLFYFTDTYAQWQQTSGPAGGVTTALYAKGDTLFCGNFEHYTLTNQGGNAGTLYRSTDHGQHWYTDSSNFIGEPLSFTHKGSTVFVSTSTDGIFKSTDNGTTWNSLSGTNSISPGTLLTVSGVIYVGTLNGVYKSTDNGNTFINASVGLPDYPGILNLAALGTTLYASVSSINGNGIYKSTNNAATWQAVNNGLPVTEWAINGGLATNATTVFASFANGVYKSTNSGASWTLSNDGFTGQVFALGDTIFASVLDPYWELYKSSNDGATWTPSSSGIPPSEEPGILVNIGREIYAGTSLYGSVYRTIDMGSSWQPSNIGLAEVDVKTIFPSGNTIFSGSLSNAGVHASSDGGNTWIPSGNGLPDDYRTVTSFTQNSSYLFTGMLFRGVYRSSNNGNSWSPSTTGLTVFGLYIDCLTTQGTDVYAGTYDGVFRSTDNGNHWTIASPIIGSSRPEVTTIVSIAGVLVAGTPINGIYRSTNNGATWTSVNGGIPVASPIHQIIVRGTDLIAGTGAGIYISSDNGITWTAKNNGLPNIHNARTVAAKGDTLVTSIYDQNYFVAVGNFISYNNGASWSGFNAGMDLFAVRYLAISNNIVFAGTENESIWKNELSPSASGTLHVASQNVTHLQASNGKFFGNDKVKVVDNNNQPVGGVTVNATYSGPSSGSATGITNNNGIVKLKTTKIANPVGAWCFTITNLVKNGYAYDASKNVSTTACDPSGFKEFSGDQESLRADKISIAPNPVAGNNANITYALSSTGNVFLKIFDARGLMVKKIQLGDESIGIHQFVLNGIDQMQVGIYLIVLEENSNVIVQGRFMVVK
ncbi:MAG: T9SS type A sorting domain-containing protein [Chitinophagales bacterium]|nr:T9SS type A sorting domain-containing protein [Chitinophagales bacterium]